MTKRSRPVQVAEEIKNWVVEQGLKPGDRLPAEPELIERFGMRVGEVSFVTPPARILPALLHRSFAIGDAANVQHKDHNAPPRG